MVVGAGTKESKKSEGPKQVKQAEKLKKEKPEGKSAKAKTAEPAKPVKGKPTEAAGKPGKSKEQKPVKDSAIAGKAESVTAKNPKPSKAGAQGSGKAGNKVEGGGKKPKNVSEPKKTTKEGDKRKTGDAKKSTGKSEIRKVAAGKGGVPLYKYVKAIKRRQKNGEKVELKQSVKDYLQKSKKHKKSYKEYFKLKAERRDERLKREAGEVVKRKRKKKSTSKKEGEEKEKKAGKGKKDAKEKKTKKDAKEKKAKKEGKENKDKKEKEVKSKFEKPTGTHASQNPSKMKKTRFVIDCTRPVEDGILVIGDLEKYFHERLKINGRRNNFRGRVTIERLKAKLVVVTRVQFPKWYMKYMAKKYLKKNNLRDWLRVVASGKDSYELRYYQINNEDEEEDAEE